MKRFAPWCSSAQKLNGFFGFSGKCNGIIDRLPVNVHQARILEQPVIVDGRYFNPVFAKIAQQAVDLTLEESGFA
ncbi:hypothetical protein ABIE48_001207 [Paenibacillus sp. OAE614]